MLRCPVRAQPFSESSSREVRLVSDFLADIEIVCREADPAGADNCHAEDNLPKEFKVVFLEDVEDAPDGCDDAKDVKDFSHFLIV